MIDVFSYMLGKKSGGGGSEPFVEEVLWERPDGQSQTTPINTGITNEILSQYKYIAIYSTPLSYSAAQNYKVLFTANRDTLTNPPYITYRSGRNTYYRTVMLSGSSLVIYQCYNLNTGQSSPDSFMIFGITGIK